MMNRYDAIMDRAKESVLGNALLMRRVEKAQLSLRWVRLKRKAMLDGVQDPEEIRTFFADWQSFGLTRIEEWSEKDKTLRALLENRWFGAEYSPYWCADRTEIL